MLDKLDSRLDRIKKTNDDKLIVNYTEGGEIKEIELKEFGNFFKSDGFLGIYQFDGNKLYYLGKDDGLLVFDGKEWDFLSDISNLDQKFKKEIVDYLENQSKDEDLIDIIKLRNLDFNGWVPPADEMAEDDLIQYIFQSAKSKKVILSAFILEELRYFLEDAKIIKNKRIDYGDSSCTSKIQNNPKVENFIDQYLDTVKVII